MHLLFFANLRETLGTTEEHWADMKGIKTAKDLLEHLKERGEPWLSSLSNPQLIISINQEVSSLEDRINAGDEVAIFPPVTGG